MTWEYGLIGLVVGIIVGAVAMRFGNKKLREQRSMQYELEKSKAELADYRQELTNHFAQSAELLDNMARDYRQLYQHMAKGSNDLLPNLPGEKIRLLINLPKRKLITTRRRFRYHATIRKALPVCCAVSEQHAINLFGAQQYCALCFCEP